MNEEVPEIEVVDTPKEDMSEDLQGQINALESEISVLEGRYDESDRPKIEALKREKMKLEEKLNS